MNGGGRLLRVIMALIIALVMGGLAMLALVLLADDVIQNGMLHLFEVLAPSDESRPVQAMATAAGRLLFLLVAAPVLVIGLIGETAHWRSGLWYVAGTALLTALIPLLMRGTAGMPTPEESRICANFAVVGLVSGTFYWWIAGSRRMPKPNDEGTQT